ncbi:MAG: hypothetical protein IKV03_03630 [Alphaproteobacteria bacterium]|nr:hypothetical protein [Alphaproteobacteria bacterium]
MLVYDTMSAMGKTCSFFGHRSIIDDVSVKQQLYEVVEELIVNQDVDTFLLGEMGDFEIIAGKVLQELKKKYPHIARETILCFSEQLQGDGKVSADWIHLDLAVSKCKRRGRIPKRNQMVVDQSDVIVCYINVPYGGAYTAYQRALKKNKQIINLTKIWDE